MIGALLATRWSTLGNAVVHHVVEFDTECLLDDPGGGISLRSVDVRFTRESDVGTRDGLDSSAPRRPALVAFRRVSQST